MYSVFEASVALYIISSLSEYSYEFRVMCESWSEV